MLLNNVSRGRGAFVMVSLFQNLVGDYSKGISFLKRNSFDELVSTARVTEGHTYGYMIPLETLSQKVGGLSHALLTRGNQTLSGLLYVGNHRNL